MEALSAPSLLAVCAAMGALAARILSALVKEELGTCVPAEQCMSLHGGYVAAEGTAAA